MNPNRKEPPMTPDQYAYDCVRDIGGRLDRMQEMIADTVARAIADYVPRVAQATAKTINEFHHQRINARSDN